VIADQNGPLELDYRDFTTMNDKGQVLFAVANPDGICRDLWLWDNGTASLLVPRFQSASQNNSGQIVGTYYDVEAQQPCNFTYDTSSMTLSQSRVSDAGYCLVKINDNGRILIATPLEGTSTGNQTIGFVSFADWSPAAPVTTLFRVPTLIDWPKLYFNADGEVSGYSSYQPADGFYASATGLVRLDGLMENPRLEVRGMNQSGVVVGQSSCSNTERHAVLWRTQDEYSWSGVLQPVNADGSSVFKAGSTVSVKFALTGTSAGISTLAATLSYAKVSDGVVVTELEAVSMAAATTGNLFRYDAASGQYVFNWSTKGLTSGTYRLIIDLGDNLIRTVDVGLK
jgi:hypothetical protein